METPPPAVVSPVMSPSGSFAACSLCNLRFSLTSVRHQCRRCGLIICSSCSRGRVRLVPGGDKERVCSDCEAAVRASHVEELEESIDVRMQINTSLKLMLKEKFEEIETYKRRLIELIMSEERYLQSDQFDTSSVENGNVDFSKLVQYLDSTVQSLTHQLSALSAKLESESTLFNERKSNFELLKYRTHQAEINAKRVQELAKQANRLNDTFKQQSATVKALSDRVEMMENRQRERDLLINNFPIDIVGDENPYIGDQIAHITCPCLKT